MGFDDSERFQQSDRDKVTNLISEVRHIKGQFEKLEAHMEKAIEAQAKTLDAQDRRIRVLENFRWWMVGAMVGSGVLTAVLNKLLEKL